jgi:hypothetical protein
MTQSSLHTAPAPQPRPGVDRRAKFKELADKRTAQVLMALDVLTQLADNAHRYVAYEGDFVEIESAIHDRLDKCMAAFRQGSRKPEFNLSRD